MAVAPAPLASVTDLAEYLGESFAETSAEGKRAAWALRMASALVRAEVGVTWLEPDGSLSPSVPEDAVLVTLAAAGRAFVNPKGLEQASEGIDDYNFREQYAEVGVYLTATERSLLGRLAETYAGGIGTVTVERGDLNPEFCWDDGSEERILPPYY